MKRLVLLATLVVPPLFAHSPRAAVREDWRVIPTYPFSDPNPVPVVRASIAAARDTYPRQPVDVQDYRFAITLSDTTDRITGVATIRLRVLAADVRTVTLDLATATPERRARGMHVSAVTRGGTALVFSHDADHLAITLDHPSTAGEEVELVVRYAGIPAGGLEIKPNKYGDRAFFSDDWPNKAHQWLPTIDHISDKATMEMDIVAPAHYQVVSNGRLMETTDLPGGGDARRTVWRESVPIAPWLYVLAAARFAVQHVGDYDGHGATFSPAAPVTCHVGLAETMGLITGRGAARLSSCCAPECSRGARTIVDCRRDSECGHHP